MMTTAMSTTFLIPKGGIVTKIELNLPKGALMNRALITLILLLASATASAVEWPWQEQAAGKSPEYCKGFVVGGLGSKKVEGMSRTELWQAWSYVIRSGGLSQRTAQNEFQAGLEQFQTVADAAAAESILQQAHGNCGLGRTGLQITGW